MTGPIRVGPQDQSSKPEQTPNPFASLALELGNKHDDPFASLADELGGRASVTDRLRANPFTDRLPDRANPLEGVAPGEELHGQTPEAERGLLARYVDNFRDMAHAIHEHPVAAPAKMIGSLVTAPVESAVHAVVSPGEGDARHDPRLSKGGAPPSMTDAALAHELDAPYDAEHGAVTSKERNEAGVQTVANILLPKLGAGLGGMVAGAAYDREDPLVGALVGGTIGKTIHGVTKGAGALAERAKIESNPATRTLSDRFKPPVDNAFADLAAEMKGEPPVSEAATLDNEKIRTSNFADMLERGAKEMPFAAKGAGAPPIGPEAQAVSDFEASLKSGAKAKPGKVQKLDTQDAIDNAVSEAVARYEALQAQAALREQTGVRRRPGGVKPDEAAPATGSLVDQMKAAIQEAPTTSEPTPEPSAMSAETPAKGLGSSSGEPPLAKGMVRLYRGETDIPPSGPIPEWIKSHPKYQAARDASGRWFSLDRASADYYAKTFGDGERTSFVDVPSDQVEGYRASNQPDVAKHSAAGRAQEEFFVPRDVAEQRRPLNGALPRYPEGFSMGDTEPRIPKIPRGVAKRQSAAVGQYLTPDAIKAIESGDNSTSLLAQLRSALDKATKGATDTGDASTTGQPVRRARLGATLSDAPRYENGTRRPVHTVSVKGLIQELLDTEERRLGAQGRSQYLYAQDDNFHSTEDGRLVMFSGKRDASGFSPQAKANQNLRDFEVIDRQVMHELEHGRGIPKEIIDEVLNKEREARYDQQARTSAGDEGDTSFDFSDETPPAEVPPETPASPLNVGERSLPDLPTGEARDAPLLNTSTFDQSPEIQGQLADATRSLEDKGVAKFTVPIAEGKARVRTMTRDALVEMGMDPTSMDLKKVGRLSGEEIVAFKQAATDAMDQIAAISKELEKPGLSADDAAQLHDVMEKTIEHRDAILERVVYASSQKGRDLGFLRQIANRSLDPDVWVVQARRLSGDLPLSDEVIANIRKLARETFEACQL